MGQVAHTIGEPIVSHTEVPCVRVVVYRVGAVISVLCHFVSVYAHRAVR